MFFCLLCYHTHIYLFDAKIGINLETTTSNGKKLEKRRLHLRIITIFVQIIITETKYLGYEIQRF